MESSKQADELPRLIEVVARLGPRNVPDIANELSIPIETARHRLKKQLLQRGIRIHASIDFGKLGLERSWAFLDFTEEYRGQEAKVARALADVAYLTYFARTTPEERFLAQFAVPRSKFKEHERFLSELVDGGILGKYEKHNLSWIRYLSMKPSVYNFRKRVWDIDWEALDRLKLTPELPSFNKATRFDKKDLLILKEMQQDSAIQFVDIASKLKIDVKTLLYHYHSHVVDRGFVSKYIVRWMGEPKNIRKYALLWAKAIIRNVSENELLLVQDTFAKLPFTWSDSYSSEDGFYLIELVLPVPQYVDALSFLQRNLRDSKRRIEILVLDPQFGSAFTLPHHMFEDEVGWMFEAETAMERFRTLTTAQGESMKNKGEL